MKGNHALLEVSQALEHAADKLASVEDVPEEKEEEEMCGVTIEQSIRVQLQTLIIRQSNVRT